MDETSCFPLFSWAIFPSVGILLGETLKKADEERREAIMRYLLDFSFVLNIAFTVFLVDYHVDYVKALVSPANRYITDFPNVILLVTLALFVISLVYYLCKLIGASKFMGFMLRISAFIVPFYLLQWIIIAWIFYLIPICGLPEECFTLPWYIFTVAAVTVICTVITVKYGMRIMKVLLKITSFGGKKKKKKKVAKA